MAFTLQDLQAGFRIGDSLVEPLQNRIVRGNSEARLEPRVMDVLVCLAQRAGEVVSRDTLNKEVWRDVIVTDQAVTNCISELRHQLGDDRTANRVIETIPKRGYRLVAPVQPFAAQAPRGGQQHDQPSPEESFAPGRFPSRAQPNEVAGTRSRSQKRWALAGGAALLVVALVSFAWWWNGSPPSAPALTSVAVMPFENAASNSSLDYLALALPDEIATLLTTSRDIAVRPLDYLDARQPLAAAHEREVDHIVTGRYYLEDDDRLSLAIEAQHVPQERVIWRTRITVPAGDLLAMRGRIAESVRSGLLPALGARSIPRAGTTPGNDEAYQLYLRSLALPQQPTHTVRAIELLERAVTLDPTFAPAWQELGLRYYDQGTYGPGGAPERQQSLAAHRRALELDPEMIDAARNVVTHRTESGDLEAAYRDARRVLEQFGSSADAHFTMSYVYRYGGMLDAAQRHCELARDHDRRDPRLRSCGYAYLYAGKLDRVMEYVLLDQGSYFSNWGVVLYHIRLDEREAALRVTRQAADDPTRGLMEPCLEGVRGAALDEPVAEFVRHWERNLDPEAAYAVAPMLAYCGRPQDALRFLDRAADVNFCAFPALDLDPAWTHLRDDPEFKRIRTRHIACADRFRRMVEAYDRTARASG